MHNEQGRLLRGGEIVGIPGDLTRTGYVRQGTCGTLYATVSWSDGTEQEVDTLFHGLNITRYHGKGYTDIPGLAVPA